MMQILFIRLEKPICLKMQIHKEQEAIRHQIYLEIEKMVFG